MVTMQQRVGIDVVAQSASSPEMNALDLGLWAALDAAVCQRYREFDNTMTKEELLNTLYAIIEDEFNKLDPLLIYSIFEHKQESRTTFVRRRPSAKHF